MITGTPTIIEASAATTADLSGTPDDQYLDGDFAYTVTPKKTWRLDRTSSAAPNGTTVLATFSGNGRWTWFPSAFDIAPFTREFFVDAGTTIPVSDQNGSVAKPFSTITAAVAAVLALTPPGAATVYVTAGTYLEQLNFSGAAFNALDGLVIAGEGADDTRIVSATEALLWVPTAASTTTKALFKGLGFVTTGATAAVNVDATASATFATDTGIQFQDCRITGSVTMTRVSVVSFFHCQVFGAGNQPAIAFNNVSQLSAGQSTFTSLAGITLDYDSANPQPTGLRGQYAFIGCGLASSNTPIAITGQANVLADESTSWSAIAITPTLGIQSLTAEIHGAITGSVTSVVVADTAAIYDFSYARISNGSLSVAKAAGANTIVVSGFYTEFSQTGGQNISFTGVVDADLRFATFDRARLVGDATATCRRTIYFPAQATAAADTTVAVPNPPLPDTNYVVKPVPLAATTTAGAPFVTGKAVNQFHVQYADGTVATSDIELTPFT